MPIDVAQEVAEAAFSNGEEEFSVDQFSDDLAIADEESILSLEMIEELYVYGESVEWTDMSVQGFLNFKKS